MNTASTAPAADSVWPIIDLLEEIGTFLDALAEHGGDAQVFHLVVLRRAGAVRVDVIDVLGRDAGVRERIVHAADDRLAVGARSRAVEGVRHLAAAFEHAEDFRAARLCGFEAFQHQRAGALRHDEAVAILGKRLGGALRRIVMGGQRRQQRESHQRLPD